MNLRPISDQAFHDSIVRAWRIMTKAPETRSGPIWPDEDAHARHQALLDRASAYSRAKREAAE